MKKKFVFGLLVVIMAIAMFCYPGLASDDAIGPSAEVLGEVTPEGINWEYLGTTAGAIAATLLIVQLFKAPLDKVFHMPTRVFLYIVACIVMLCAQWFTGRVSDIGDVMLVFINAAGVSLSAMGAYELTFANHDRNM